MTIFSLGAPDHCSSNTQCPRNSVCCGRKAFQAKVALVAPACCSRDVVSMNHAVMICVFAGKIVVVKAVLMTLTTLVVKRAVVRSVKMTKCNQNIIIPVTAARAFIVIVVIVVCGYFYNRRRQQRLMAFSNVPFGHLTESTTSYLPQPITNPFQQHPPEYTASVTPPQYTLTSSNGSSGMNATPKASVTSPHHQ